MDPGRRASVRIAAVSAVGLATFALARLVGARPLTLVAATLLGIFVTYALMNLPRRHRRHGQGQIEEARDHGAGRSGGTYPEEPVRARRVTKVGRNDPCPCGSGLKHKQCCGA